MNVMRLHNGHVMAYRQSVLDQAIKSNSCLFVYLASDALAREIGGAA